MTDIFDFRKKLIDRYRSFSTSFANPRSADISSVVQQAYDKGTFWPDPLIQINPNYKKGSRIDTLVLDGSVEPETAKIFQVGKQDDPPAPTPITLYKHQMNALAFVASNKSYVVTTGTGSGKSLTFFIPIVNRIIKEKKSDQTPRIRAIIVYPMNALANSQMEEINKFLNGSTSVRVARYTGQDEATERAEIKRNPPDILLTNYVMLDLILTRYHEDHAIVEAAQKLEFLVLDELHTYRGRQGADVAMLVRRVRAQLNAANMLCIGTSATMASVGTTEDRQDAVARVASKMFDAPIPAANVVMEELEYATGSMSDADMKNALPARVVQSVNAWNDLDAFRNDPLAIWIERNLGIRPNPSDGNLERARPQTVEKAAEMLSADSGQTPEKCADALRGFLTALHAKKDWPGGRPPFAFKLHQFVSGPSQVMTTLEPTGTRIVTLEAQRFAPGSSEKRLFTTYFCRFCGEEYIPVWYNATENGAPVSVEPRDINDSSRTAVNASGGSSEFGFLCPAETLGGESAFAAAFGAAPSAINDYLPDEWFTLNKKGERILSDSYKDRVPRPIRVLPNGMISSSEGTPYWFMPGRHVFCLQCGQTHTAYGRDSNRLVGLSGEGRSSATTILTLSALNLMYELGDGEANKLLGFTDNRQDAALQSGHFNEFIFAVTLRAALLRALQCADEQRLGSDEIAAAVFAALGFKSADKGVLSEYLENPELTGAFLIKAQKAIRYMLGYRLHEDLGREWRFNNPNLEQLRMIDIKYLGVNEMVADEAKMSANPILAALDVTRRRQFAHIVLDHLRKALCIRSEYFDPEEQERVRKGGNAYLVDTWQLPSERDRLSYAKSLIIFRNRREDLKQNDLTKDANRRLEKGYAVSGSFQSRFFRALVRGDYGNGKSLWTGTAFTGPGNAKSYQVTAENRGVLLDAAITILKAASTGIVDLSNIGTETSPVWKCELCAEAIIWTLREDDEETDAGRVRADGSIRNLYFRQLYAQVAQTLGRQGEKIYTYESHEHTAQVEPELRELLELRFRNKPKDRDDFAARYPDQRFKPLPVLYCSPTMELGVDISSLDMVYMRNVPPTPANYAQRSGRAGRSGQAALVVTYCTSLSPHDQWFFQRMEDMVHGEVCVPALDLTNQELVESHLRSVWLSCVKKELPVNISELLQVGAPPALLLKTEIQEAFTAPEALKEAKQIARKIMQRLAETEYKKVPAPWYGPAFVDSVIDAAPENFTRALDRWRTLYLATQEQIQKSAQIVANPAASPQDRDRAGRVLNDAKNQLNVLLCQRDGGSASAKNRDFYLYRYLASEGTLPGYSFPRLPVTAWIPRVHSTGGRTKSSEMSNGTMISRPRFLALSEFGPLSFIYHEGHMFCVKRVKLRAAEVQAGEGGNFTIGTKNVRICPKCGHGHFANENDCGVATCKNCGEPLSGVDSIKMLYQVNAVEAWNKERISMQDEERQRRGYDLMTTYDFESKKPFRVEVAKGTDAIASLVYCPAANISRINLGWRRRADPNQFGFWMDPTNGEWTSDNHADGEDSEETGNGAVNVTMRPIRIVPYVNDHRNVLIFTPSSDIIGDSEAVTTLIAALTRGIAQTFQLESGEVAAEPVPNAAHPEKILIYEASEGGAGALGRLTYDPDRAKVLAQIARSALETMHYHLEDGQWLENKNHCEAGCYKCLLSYYNQPQHDKIDRRNAAVLDYLKKLTKVKSEDYHEPAEQSDGGVPSSLAALGCVAYVKESRTAQFAAEPSDEAKTFCDEKGIAWVAQG